MKRMLLLVEKPILEGVLTFRVFVANDFI